MIGNTPRRETNIYVEASKSFAFGIQFKKENGDPLDLTDCVVRMVVSQPNRYGGAEVLDLEAVHITDSLGLVQFQFQAEDLALSPGTFPYDVTLVTPLFFSVPILKGELEVGRNTDQDISNVYTDVHTGSEITAIIADSNVVEITIERVDGMLTVVQGLIEDFRVEMQGEVTKAETAATDAEYWSTKTTTDINDLKTWMVGVGFPYWKGTKAAYLALANPDPSILYLLID